MTKIALALGSFTVGAATTLLLMSSGSHTSIEVQAPPLLAQGHFIGMPGAIPVVPPLGVHVVRGNFAGAGRRGQQV